MPARIADACARLGQSGPAGPGELVRSILLRWPASTAAPWTGSSGSRGRIEVVHLIGGGSRNALLCQLTADLRGRPVLAGPVEATALGNVLVQARADGELGSLAESCARSPWPRPGPSSLRAAATPTATPRTSASSP